MSGPIQSLADPMSTYNTSMRFLQEQRNKTDAERRVKVNKEADKALSSSKPKCNCDCHPKLHYTAQEIEEDMEWERKHRERWRALAKESDKRYEICTIL